MPTGRPFLQIPGPTNVPERIVRAMARPLIDHRSPEFGALVLEALDGLRRVFATREGTVVLFPGSGTAGWEAAVVNTLQPGDRVLAGVNGVFSAGFAAAARALGMIVETLEVPWGEPVRPDLVGARLRQDHARALRAVLVAHNETSTGVRSDIAGIRDALDAVGHPALLLVDAVSSLGSMPFDFDGWRVDVAVCGAQKGLMLPPGMALLCASPRALAAGEGGGSPRYFLDWRPVIEQHRAGFFPYTPATALIYGLREALAMLFEEGLPQVFARHARLAEGVRRAVRAWELATVCRDPQAASDTLTAVMTPDGVDGERLVAWAGAHLNLRLGTGLGRLRGRAFRIGHLGWLNEVEVMGVLGGTELALVAAGVPVPPGRGVAACAAWFVESLVPVGSTERRERGAAPGPR